MAGIIATSVSRVMTSGETTANNSVTGHVTQEEIALSVTPSGSTYIWAMARPVSSASTRSALSATNEATATFTPDVAGPYVITLTVDGSTAYTLILNVTQTAAASAIEALRLTAKTDTAVSAPPAGVVAVYNSDDIDALSQKLSSGQIVVLRPGKVGANITDASATITVAEGSIRSAIRSTFTAPRSTTLGTSGAVIGDIIELLRFDTSAHAWTIINGGDSSTIATISAVSQYVFKFNGTHWVFDSRRVLV